MEDKDIATSQSDFQNNSLEVLNDILKIEGKTIDQLSHSQKVILARYLELFSDHKQTLYGNIKVCDSSSIWLCYFTYIHYSRYHKSRDSYSIICIDKDFSVIKDTSIDFPNKRDFILNDVLSEEDQKFHEERLKKPRENGTY